MIKGLYLFWKRIRQYICNNVLLFLLFILLGLINTIIFVYAYGNFLPIIAQRGAQESVYRQYMVSFQDEDDFVSYQPYEAIQDGLQRIVDNSLVEEVEISVRTKDDLSLVAFAKNNSFLAPLRGTTELANRHEIVAAMGSGVTVGSKCMIEGVEFTVVGESDQVEWCISYEDLQELNFAVGSFYVYSAKRHDTNDSAIEDMIKESFPMVSIKSPSSYMRSNSSLSVMYIVLLCVGYLVETISFTSLLHYIMRRGMKENIATALVGATPNRITGMVFAEGFAFSIIPVVLALLIHRISYDSFLAQYNLIKNVTYYDVDYIWIFLVMCALIGMVLLIFSIKYHRKSVIALKNDSMNKGK